MANQPQPRPWFRLATLARGRPPAPAPAPAPSGPPLARPGIFRPPFRPTTTTTAAATATTQPQTQPSQQAPAPPPSAPAPPPPATAPAPRVASPPAASPPPPMKPSSPSPQISPFKPSPPTPKSSPKLPEPSSLPSSPKPKASPSPPPPSSPALRQVRSPSLPTYSPSKPSSPPKPPSMPASPPPKLSPSPSSSSPKQVIAPSPPKPSSPSPKQAPAISASLRGPTPKASPRIDKPQPETPPQSPKTKPTLLAPPSPFTLPPSQLKSEHAPKIPAQVEQKTVVVQETIGKSKSFLGSNGANHVDPKVKHYYKKPSSSEFGDEGMRIITIAGENRGAIMELGYSSPRRLGSSHVHSNPHGSPVKSHYKVKSDGELSDIDSKRGSNGMGKSSVPMHAIMNSNVQGVNSSILFNSTLSHHDPGLHLSLSRKPVNGNGKNVFQNGKGKWYSD